MDVQQSVTERAKRPVTLKCDLHLVTHATMLYEAGRKLWIPYQVFGLDGKKIRTKNDDELTCYVAAEDFSFDFDRYGAASGVFLTWILDQVGKTINRQIDSLQFELTARMPRIEGKNLEFFHPQVRVVGDSKIKFRSFANHENRLVHWSEFFEQGDAMRREIHTAYQQLYRTKKPESDVAEMDARIRHIVRNSL